MQSYRQEKPFNERIRELIRDTHTVNGPLSVIKRGKRFEVIRNPVTWRVSGELTATDGIGTKGMLHWIKDSMENAAVDAFAMVTNDLAEGGYLPFMLQDHIIMQKEDEGKILRLVNKLVSLCLSSRWPWPQDHTTVSPIAITGGETAIIGTLKGLEIGITATGYVIEGGRIDKAPRAGDVMIGIGSSGVHSNGLSFLTNNMNAKDGLAVEVLDELTKPTIVYLQAINELISELDSKGGATAYLRGMVHITGGGLSKLRELIGARRDIDINIGRRNELKPQWIFEYAHAALRMHSETMYKTFNNGIGYVIVVDPSVADEALGILGRFHNADIIGEVTAGKGRVAIESRYDYTTVVYE